MRTTPWIERGRKLAARRRSPAGEYRTPNSAFGHGWSSSTFLRSRANSPLCLFPPLFSLTQFFLFDFFQAFYLSLAFSWFIFICLFILWLATSFFKMLLVYLLLFFYILFFYYPNFFLPVSFLLFISFSPSSSSISIIRILFPSISIVHYTVAFFGLSEFPVISRPQCGVWSNLTFYCWY